MKLGRKLAEGVAVDLDAEPMATPEPRTEPENTRVEVAATTEERAEVRAEHARV